MPLRVVISFKLGGEGWSEVYWNSGSSADAYLVTDLSGRLVVGTGLARLLENRLPLLVPSSFYNHVRVTEMASGVSQGERSYDPPSAVGVGIGGTFPIPYAAGTWPGTATAAEAFSKLLISMESSTTRRKRMWLGGIPESIIEAPQTYSPRPPWPDKFGIFTNFLVNAANGYGIYGRTSTNQLALTSFSATSASGTFASATPVPTGAPAVGIPFYVVLRGLKNPPGWNGRHRAIVIAGVPPAPDYVLIGPTRRSMRSVPVWVLGTGGSIQTAGFVFTPFDRIRPVRVTKRNVGRPFGLPVGRRDRR